MNMLVLDKKNPSFINPRNRHFLFDLKLIFYPKPHVQVRKWKKEKAFLSVARSEYSPEKRNHNPKESPMAALGKLWRKKPVEGWEGNRQSYLLGFDSRGSPWPISSEKDNELILKTLKFEIPGAKD